MILYSSQGASGIDETNCLFDYVGKDCDLSVCEAKVKKLSHSVVQTNNQIDLKHGWW